ncbi:MAG: DUF6438 domain-containing protein [Bacteroidota bacterium]|jgi:hypothetical protein
MITQTNIGKALLAILLMWIFSSEIIAQTANKPIRKKNYIDSITTTEEVLNLIRSIEPKLRFQPASMQTDMYDFCKQLRKSNQTPDWMRADIDQNGLSDIVIADKWNILVILAQSNSYRIETIKTGMYQCMIADIHKNKIRYRLYSQKKNNVGQPDTHYLVYKYGGIVDENPLPSKHRITKISYSTSRCHGKCAVFELQIDDTKQATLKAIADNRVDDKLLDGAYSTIIKEKDYQQIIDLLNYMNFEQLNASYYPGLKDAQQATLTITYDNGKIKTITDNGMNATQSLTYLHRLLFDLRKNQDWKK